MTLLSPSSGEGAHGGVSEYAKAAALGVCVSLLLVFFFSPSWVAFRAWIRVPELFSQIIYVARGSLVATQVVDPFVEIEDPIHKIVRWRLLMPMVGHYLGLAPGMVLALAHLGCVLVLVMIIRFGRGRGFAWPECAMLAVVVGAGAWFFASTGWLGYYDSWLALGLLTVAWARSRWLLWLACVLTPWVDERFVLGFPLAVLVRWIGSSRVLSMTALVRWLVPDVALAAGLVAAYLAFRLGLAGQSGTQTVAEYWRDLEFAQVPLWRLFFGAWEGLRAGWIPVLAATLVLAERRQVLAAALLAIGVCGTTVAGLVSANDLSRSVAMVLPAVPLGWELARTRAWWTRWHVAPALCGAALLLPANHVVSTFTVPVEQLWHEIRLLLDPPPPFSPDPYLQEAQLSVNRGDLNRAEQLVTIAVRLAPSANTHNGRGVVLARQGRWVDALHEFDTAVLMDPGLAEALMNRAKARAAQGDEAGARRDAQRADQLALPQSAVAARSAEVLRSLDGSVR